MEKLETPLEKSVRLCGGQAGLARRIGTKQQNVAYWLNKARKGVPAEMAAAIEDAVGGRVTRQELRPDVKWFDTAAPSSEQAA